MEMHEGSGNIFADLGLEDAEELHVKSAVAMQINSIIEHRRITQAQAAEILGTTQPKISALLNGRLNGFSLEKLLGFMLRLDRNVELRFSKSRAKLPQMVVASGKKRISVAA